VVRLRGSTIEDSCDIWNLVQQVHKSGRGETRGTQASRQIRMMLNEDDDLVLLDILCIFTFNNFYHLLKDIFGFLCFKKVIFSLI
jgi:hypothetical protein